MDGMGEELAVNVPIRNEDNPPSPSMRWADNSHEKPKVEFETASDCHRPRLWLKSGKFTLGIVRFLRSPDDPI